MRTMITAGLALALASVALAPVAEAKNGQNGAAALGAGVGLVTGYLAGQNGVFSSNPNSGYRPTAYGYQQQPAYYTPPPAGSPYYGTTPVRPMCTVSDGTQAIRLPCDELQRRPAY